MSSDAEAPWPRTVTLKHAVDHGSAHITSLEFRRGRLGDLKGVKIGEMPSADQLMLLASRMCGQPIQVIEKLDSDDAEEVLGVALLFFAKCLPVMSAP